MPQVSVHAGWVFPAFNLQQNKEIDLGEGKLSVHIQAGFNSDFHHGSFNQYEGYEAFKNVPNYSTNSGMNTPFQASNIETYVPDLEYNRPSVSAASGVNTVFEESNYETPVGELRYNRPQISGTAGTNTFFQASNIETPIDELEYNLPQVHAESGQSFVYTAPFENQEFDLEEKLGGTPLYIQNPGSESDYISTIDPYQQPDKYLQERQSYSYSVPQEEPIYRADNYNHNPHVRERLQPSKSYGQISQSSGAMIPKNDVVDVYRDMLRENFSGYGRQRNTSKRYGSDKRKPTYSIGR
jgi:hypothetical protein